MYMYKLKSEYERYTDIGFFFFLQNYVDDGLIYLRNILNTRK